MMGTAHTMHWAEQFALWLHDNGKAGNTISAYLQDLRHFSQFFTAENKQGFEPGLLNATDVKKYFAMQDDDRNTAARSRNRRLASLKVFVRWCAEAGLLEYDPTLTIRRQPVKTLPRDRSAQEMQALNQVIDAGAHLRRINSYHTFLGKRDRMIWILCKDAGLRESEIVNAEVSDVSFTEGKLYVMGKGKRKDFVILSKETMDEIASWLDVRPAGTSQALVTDESGNPISRSQVWRRIKLMGKAAGIPNLRPHDLRHTYGFSVAQRLLAQGLPQLTAMNGVRDQLRHGDTKTSALYFGIRESQIRAAMESTQ